MYYTSDDKYGLDLWYVIHSNLYENELRLVANFKTRNILYRYI